MNQHQCLIHAARLRLNPPFILPSPKYQHHHHHHDGVTRSARDDVGTRRDGEVGENDAERWGSPRSI